MTLPVTEHWIQTSGLELYVEDRGEGPAILLAHGMWCDAGMFDRVATDLARDHRVLVPDLRAHGRSTVPDRPWRIADVADDLAALLDQLEVPRVTLLGFSMGGMAAADFAVRFRQRLSGLALVGTSAAAEELVRVAEIRALARLIKLAGPPRFLAHEAARATFSPAFRKRSTTQVARWQNVVRAMSGPALAQALRAVASRPSLLERLAEVRVPTLVVAGGDDRVMKPRWSTAMHRRLPRSRLVLYPGTGHAVPIERPSDLAGLVRGLAAGSLPADG